jgi:hypothetical protein
VRRAGHSAYSEEQWVIELPDQTRVSVPRSWAIAVEQTAEPGPSQKEPVSGFWVNVTTLLNLARMVRRLTENQPEEVELDETINSHGPPSKSSQPAARPADSVSPLGESATSVSARDGHGADDDADQANCGLSLDAGEER